MRGLIGLMRLQRTDDHILSTQRSRVIRGSHARYTFLAVRNQLQTALPDCLQMSPSGDHTDFVSGQCQRHGQIATDGTRAEHTDLHGSIAIQTVFGSVKFSNAASPCSRPNPDSPDPPQGNRTSVYP